MTSAAASAYAQVLSLGLLWTSVHCAGMCGPLLIGLDVAGVRCGRGAARGAGQVLAYQGGRALTYAWIGGLAGALGAGLTRTFAPAGAALALLLGALTLLLALRRLWPQAPVTLYPVRRSREAAGAGALAERALRALSSTLPTLRAGQSLLGSAALGALLGFLPCMVALWTLGLAALSGSALHGAALMLLLVAMTTPMLLGVTLLPRLLRRAPRVWLLRAPALLQAVSGLWLLLIGAAGAGLIGHRHLGFTLWGRGLLVMLF